MDKLDINSFTKEQIAKAKECKTPEELIELARKYDLEITKEQAKAYYRKNAERYKKYGRKYYRENKWRWEDFYNVRQIIREAKDE